MSCWTRLPIRQRLTITFAASMAAMIAGLGAFVYIRTGADLLDTVDAGLRSRAELLVTDLQHHDQAPVDVEPTLIESDEVFAQIADAAGMVTQSSPKISRWRLLPPRDIRSLRVPGFYAGKSPASTTWHGCSPCRCIRPAGVWWCWLEHRCRIAGMHSSNWDGPWPSRAQPRSP